MGNDMGSKGRVTIREVAERAGVSTATASRALSGNHPVPAATRARVLRAARDLDYGANAHARALVGGGRKMAAVVVRQVTSPFYAQVAEGVEAEAADRGWLCVVGATGGDAQREMEFVQLMREEGARLVLGGNGMPDGLDRGWYVRPTVFADVDNRMRIAQEEIFGPVLSVIAYDDVDDAVRIANDSEYGLAGTVDRRRRGRARRGPAGAHRHLRREHLHDGLRRAVRRLQVLRHGTGVRPRGPGLLRRAEVDLHRDAHRLTEG